MPLSLRSCLAAFFMLTGVLSARADPAVVVARARAYLGGDTALRAINSIRYVGGYLSEVDGEKRTGAVELIFVKQYLHRAVVTIDTAVETTGLDDYEGWLRVHDSKDPGRFRLTYLGKDQTKGLRANTWESLYFYEGIEKRGGRILELGEATIDNVVCDKLAFEHEPGLVFYRYFDKATGKLMQTETAQGSTREEGSMIVDGVRFPQKIIQKVKVAGKERTITLAIEKVTVNEVFPASVFKVPSVPMPTTAPAKSATTVPAAPAKGP